MWLFKSSIGRKVVMAVTGAALVLTLTQTPAPVLKQQQNLHWSL